MKKKSFPQQFIFGDSYIQQSDAAVHLGIRQDSNLSLSNRISERCQKAKNAFYAMVDLGLRPEVFNPLTSVRLYITVIIPSLLYGCELWNNMSRTDPVKLSQLQHFITKKIQGFHVRARSDMVESALGLNRITALVDKRKLMFLFKILNLDNSSICKQIFLRKLFHYLYSSVKSKHGFIPDICSLLIKYNLNFLLNVYVNDKGYLPQKRVWRQFVHSSVNFVENNEFLDRLKAAEFSRFSQLHKSISPCS